MNKENKNIRRCQWAEASSSLRLYHDKEWGVPVKDDRELFEHLSLDIFQAGLSWRIVLEKREALRARLANFDPEKLSRFDRKEVERALKDPAIIRNEKKILAAIDNAKAFLNFLETQGSFAEFLWSFVGGKTIVNSPEKQSDLPAKTKESIAMSEALKKIGFKFVGPTICYAFMQAVGMVNDHLVDCFRREELIKLSKKD